MMVFWIILLALAAFAAVLCARAAACKPADAGYGQRQEVTVDGLSLIHI